MNNHDLKLLVRVICLFLLVPLPIHPQPDRQAGLVLQAVSIDSIKQHLYILGSDSLEGRATGSPGAQKTAHYIARKLEQYGVLAMGDDGTYFQDIPMHGSLPLTESQLQLISADSSYALELWQDYILFNAGAQTFIPNPIPLVFAGYGIFAPEYDYNDYTDLNVENKIVVFLSGEPLSDDETYFDGKQPTLYSDPVMKQRIALSRGARGSILIPSYRDGRFLDWNYWRSQFRFEDVKLPYGVTDNLNILLNRAYTHLLFRGAKYDLEDVTKLDSNGVMHSFPLETRARFSGKFRERDFVSSNVVGILEGRDPLLQDSYLLLSAHYDHLGIGDPVAGDSIYNGVIDNAIGVAAALELARNFSELETAPRRSIVFLFLTGEEKGLLGSKFYCDQPIVPLHKTIAAINIDGIAIFDTFNSITGVGAAYSTLGEMLETVAHDLKLTVSPTPPVFLEKEPFFDSDQYSFALAGIPSILIMEGLDYKHLPQDEGLQRFIQWGRQIYHTPFDDLQQEIDYDAVRQHIFLIGTFVHRVADTFVEPQWLPGTQFIDARLQSIAERR